MLTNQSIIDLVGAEVPETVIIGHIRASKTKFDLSTAEIITLSKSDVPPAVIEAMRNPSRARRRLPRPAAPTRRLRFRAADTRLVPLLGGVPFEITLMEDVPNDPAEGLPLHFQAAKDYHVDGAVVIAKGAAVTGEVLGSGQEESSGARGQADVPADDGGRGGRDEAESESGAGAEFGEERTAISSRRDIGGRNRWRRRGARTWRTSTAIRRWR